MSEGPDDQAAQTRRRRLREALDEMAPDPVTVADRSDAGDSTDGGGTGAKAAHPGGLSEEDLRREVPPHHGG